MIPAFNHDGLGDAVERALTTVGVTKELVERWIGKCCCAERKMKLNSLDSWTRQVISGRILEGKKLLETMMGVE